MKALGPGGAERIVLNAAQCRDSARFDYEIAYLLPSRKALVPQLREIGLPVHCLDGARGIGWMRRLRHLVRDRQIKLIHCHAPYVSIGARLSFRRHRPPIVSTEHNTWGRYRRLTYWGNLLTLPRSDHVFAVSEGVRESIRYPRMLRFLRMPPVETLIHGLHADDIDTFPDPEGTLEELGIGKDALIVGTIANFKPHKGLEFLLEAAATIHIRQPRVRFVLVGDGPLGPQLRRKAAELGLTQTVAFAGSRPDALRLASVFDLFVLPSVTEGLPIALLEAMALAKPVLATAVGGVPEIIEPGVDGLLVPPRDVPALVEGIETLLESPRLRLELGAAARRRASSFDIREAVRRMETIYDELVR
jgi:glycosyltransferase involved in cell wall biosynthesis